VLRDLQPHNFIDGQTIAVGIVATRNPYVTTAVAHAYIGFAVVPRTITTALATAFHATAVITEVAVVTATQLDVTVVGFVLLVDVGWATIRRGGSVVGKRVRIIGIAGVEKITDIVAVVVASFEEIAVGHFHHFFYQ